MDNPFQTLHERFDRMEKLMEQLITSGAIPAPAAVPAAVPAVADESLVTPEHVALHLGNTKQTVLKLARNGVIPFYKPGKNYMFKLSEVDRALSSQTPIKRRNKGGSNG
jgi:excisionase family DNA binding protein